MKKADNLFFEAFKELETLCGEIYSCRSGVSEYILDMEKRMAEGEKRVENWTADYKTLKHLRWVRNKIAHEAGEQRISEERDLDTVCSFRDRLLRGKDPISLLNRMKKPAVRSSARSAPAAKNASGKSNTGKKKNVIRGVIIFEILVLSVALYFLIRMVAGL